jgi:uroporphyrinogen decarboxylase
MIEPIIIQVLKGHRCETVPIWLMRQAGRYLPEYRQLRECEPDFIRFCLTSELAVEASLQPIRRFGFDAAILFADILLVPYALGQKLWFTENSGPHLDALREVEGLERLAPASCIEEILEPVFSTVRILRAALSPEVGLIGFAGAPWTVASYMIAGQGGDNQQAAKVWAYREPESFQRLIDRLIDATVEYLAGQVKAGVQALQLFESWAGGLSMSAFERWCIKPARRISEGLKRHGLHVPLIGFPRLAGVQILRYASEGGVDALSLDHSIPLDWALANLPRHMALQGNLDPTSLLAGGNALKVEAERICLTLQSRPHVFNLGHGIMPQTPPDHVAKLVDYVREVTRSSAGGNIHERNN